MYGSPPPVAVTVACPSEAPLQLTSLNALMEEKTPPLSNISTVLVFEQPLASTTTMSNKPAQSPAAIAVLWVPGSFHA